MIKLPPDQMSRLRYLFHRNQQLMKEQYEVQDELATLCRLRHGGQKPDSIEAQKITFEEFLETMNISNE